LAVLKKLEDIASVRALTREEKLQYDRTLKIYRDNYSVYLYEKEQREKRWAEGVAEGMAKGIAEGMAKGRAEAKITLLNTARNLKNLGTPIDIIVKSTGLSATEIENL
ncbi:MAG: hypothetical protein LBM62_01950, partial [Mediterranea sp.]|jgi:predicted transposase YdaD|nr:hypothetical protein [Mediterranea sp.]